MSKEWPKWPERSVLFVEHTSHFLQLEFEGRIKRHVILLIHSREVASNLYTGMHAMHNFIKDVHCAIVYHSIDRHRQDNPMAEGQVGETWEQMRHRSFSIVLLAAVCNVCPFLNVVRPCQLAALNCGEKRFLRAHIILDLAPYKVIGFVISVWDTEQFSQALERLNFFSSSASSVLVSQPYRKIESTSDLT